jgi:hypothetical protein
MRMFNRDTKLINIIIIILMVRSKIYGQDFFIKKMLRNISCVQRKTADTLQEN